MDDQHDPELRDENVYPDDQVLESVLGKAFRVYLKLLDLFKSNDLIYEWRYYQDGKVWLCKIQKKKKTIIWMSVRTQYLIAAI